MGIVILSLSKEAGTDSKFWLKPDPNCNNAIGLKPDAIDN